MYQTALYGRLGTYLLYIIKKPEFLWIILPNTSLPEVFPTRAQGGGGGSGFFLGNVGDLWMWWRVQVKCNRRQEAHEFYST